MDIAQAADAEAGLVADSPEEIARAIDPLLRDDALRANTGEVGRQFVRREFDWREVGKRMKSVYEEVLARG